MEVDTGVFVSILSEGMQKSKFYKLLLKHSSIQLKKFTNQPREVLGEAIVDIEYEGQQSKLRLVVVSGDAICTSSDLQTMLEKYKLYEGNLGTVKSFQGELSWDYAKRNQYLSR